MGSPTTLRQIAGPTLFLIVAEALLIYDHLQGHVSEIVFWLGLVLILAVFLKLIGTIRRDSQTIERHGRRELVDELSGLPNRRQLISDLDRALGAPGEPLSLVLLELDGLRSYGNDVGKSEADALLRAIADRLTAAVEPMSGTAYRLDGNTLATLVPHEEQQLGQVVAAAVASADERETRGDEREGSAIVRSCYGEATIPEDAQDSEGALQVAARRLDARKQRQQNSARRQAHAALVAVLNARKPELRAHQRVVAPRVVALGRKLGLEGEALEDVVLAAALQDIGLLTVPEKVLEKRTALSESEISLIENHPLAGERIIGAAPALGSVAALVRSSYERFDGKGYPDGLAAEETPLGARIISVCVALAAMTSARPYRPAMSLGEAIGELRRCAGTQFDPAVVEALADDLSEEVSVPPPTSPRPIGAG